MLKYFAIFCVLGSSFADKLPTNYGGPSGGQASYGQPTYGNGLSADEENLKMLMNSIPGTPGEDYPIFSEVPESEFSCSGQKVGGYYADPEAQCQVFHICAEDGDGPRSKWSFLCPNGTIFNQNYFICDWWFNFDCSTAEGLYSLNDQLGEGLATYNNAAESQNTPSYVSGNQPSYQTPKAAPKKAPAPKPKKGNGNTKSAKPQTPKNNYAAPAAAQGAGNSYGSPSAETNYGAPSGSYGSPASSSYGSPASDQSAGSNYGPPTNDYSSPAEDDLADYSSSPSESYGAPAASDYGAPANDNYGAPEAPVSDYAAASGRSGRQRNGKAAFGRRG